MKGYKGWALALCLALVLCLGTQHASGEECGHYYDKFISRANERYELAGLTTHTCIYNEREQLICVLCGHILLEKIGDEEISVQERHAYENGACSECGFVNLCKHSNGTETEIVEYSTQEEGFQLIDALTHGGVGARREYVRCVTCGENINQCEHVETTREDWFENVVYEDLNENAHSVTADVVAYVTCAVCLEELGSEMKQEGVEAKEAHVYAEGACIRCGHAVVCAHGGSMSSNFFIWDRKCEALDEKTHIARGPMYEVTECKECGQAIEKELYAEQGSIEEEHCFEAGVCVECGYVNACTHENTTIRVYIDSAAATARGEAGEGVISFEREDAFEAADDRIHIARGDRRQETACLDCAAVVSDVLLEENVEEIGVHSLNGYGECLFCSYACPHESKVVLEVWQGAKYEQLSADTHRKAGDRYEAEICAVCSMEFSRQIIEKGAQAEEKHVYSGNTCTLCGAVGECSHEQVNAFFYVDGAVYELVDEWIHTERGTLRLMNNCMTCFAALPVEDFSAEIERTRNHTFIDGLCIWCDAPSQCGHELVRAFDYGLNGVHTPIDEYTHSAEGEIYCRTDCRECLIFLGDAPIPEKSRSVSEHVFVSGVCAHCKYACTHEEMAEGVYMAAAAYARLDAETHMAYGMKCEGRVCAVCGLQQMETLLEQYAEETQVHTFEGGACVYCGQREE